MRIVKILMIALSIFVLFFTPVFAQQMEQEEPTVGMKVLDLLVVRPLSIVVSAASTAIHIVTVPVTFPAGVSEPAARILVEAPWRFTGMRCLGHFNRYKDGNPITVVYEE